jgi:hypothetical protein
MTGPRRFKPTPQVTTLQSPNVMRWDLCLLAVLALAAGLFAPHPNHG